MDLHTLLCIVLMLEGARGEALSSFIKHYEPLQYDSESLIWHHHRVRRSMVGERALDLKFSAFGREFDLILKPETRFFHQNFSLYIDGVKSRNSLAKYNLYSGTDRNDPSVRVHGNMAHEVFDGTIIADDEMYHIEPARRYLRDTDHHSVIYKHSDLDLSSVAGAACGSSHESIRKEVLKVQESVIRDAKSARLRKRQNNPFDPNLVRCWLYALADYRFVQALRQVGDNPVGIMSSIILTGSTIFEGTDFNEDGTPDNIHFGILMMEVETTPPPNNNFFANDFIGVQAFLDRHSQADWSDFCLAYRFTNRDFENGVVGLAYVAPQPNENSAGGICENMRTFQGGTMKTLNTGIVTILNYGARIPPSVSALTFAHEAGHNFGSNHDPRSDPVPADGVYLMDAFATDGTRPNNRRFSLRSRQEISPVIEARGQSTSQMNPGCFVEGDNLCGNNLLDEGEQCDCGPSFDPMTGICTNNLCCNGRNCTLHTNVQCSPDQGPCCNSSTCMFTTAATNLTCSMDTDCAMAQTCNGSTVVCPDPNPLPNDPGQNYRLCMGGEAVCEREQCTGTFCVALGLPDCECSSVEQACHVCCRLPGGNCISTIDIAEQNVSGLARNLPNGMGAFSPIGFPCINFTGFCDFFNRCMITDTDGALTRLTNLIFNSAEFQLILRWISTMWWAVLLIGIGIIIIMFFIVLLFHFCLPRPEKLREKRVQRREQIHMEQLQGYHRRN